MEVVFSCYFARKHFFEMESSRELLDGKELDKGVLGVEMDKPDAARPPRSLATESRAEAGWAW